LLSWLHLSDIHVGQGDEAHRWNQKQVLEDLLLDLKRMQQLNVPRPELVFVTGDIATKGYASEYTEVRAWLEQVLNILSLSSSQLFLIPGNHDVDRRIESEHRTIQRLLTAVRGGNEPIDAVLEGKEDQIALSKRMAGFLSLAQDFAPWKNSDTMPESHQRLWWKYRTKVASGQALRIVGLNTALLAADNNDKGKLRVGQRQLAEGFLDHDADELVIVLSHHPFVEGWLADQEDVGRRVGAKGHIHLFGHIHGQEIESSMRGSGHNLIRVCAGAVHPGQGESVPPSGHGYNIAGIFPLPQQNEGRAELRVWPRRYSPRNQEFREDNDNLPAGGSFSTIPLTTFRSRLAP
jgi:3',5'-cyclic AMP phosphodiesterase CpdA